MVPSEAFNVDAATGAGSSVTCGVMEAGSLPVLPTYAQSSEHRISSKRTSLCQTLSAFRLLEQSDPLIIAITLAVLIGSFSLISGFVLLCMVSKEWHDDTSEAILLMCIGFFVTSLSCATWKLTKAQRLPHIQQTTLI